MRSPIVALTLTALVLGGTVPARSFTLLYTNAAANVQVKWVSNPIDIAFSTSLNSPPSNIKAGSDVIGAANRALARWAQASSVRFNVISSDLQSVTASESSGRRGTHMGFVTVANTPENAQLFQGTDRPARTRIFYNADNGAISEADVVVNPGEQFSTDGTAGTYDLESTLAHEIGHLLGLEHSGVVASTMQPRQARNGLYSLPANIPRTLSDDDRAGIRAIYGPKSGGAISGRVTYAGGAPAYGAHVWAADALTGKVYAGNITQGDGRYLIESLPTGQYFVRVESLDGLLLRGEIPSGDGAYRELLDPRHRDQPPFRTVEVAERVNIGDGVASVNVSIPNGPPLVHPRFIGLNGQLSTIAVPLAAGNTYSVYVGGEGIIPALIPPTGITTTSRFITIDPSSVVYTRLDDPNGSQIPVVTFSISTSAAAQAGDYSIRFQSNTGEVASVTGGLSIDPGVDSAFNNAIDDPAFFVRRHYTDFYGREADGPGLEYWMGRITRCGTDAACLRSNRIAVSAAFSGSQEFDEPGTFIFRLYRAALGRDPHFDEFNVDSGRIGGDTVFDQNRHNFVVGFASRPEFAALYPSDLTGADFVPALIAMFHRSSGVDLTVHSGDLRVAYDQGTDQIESRASVLESLVNSSEFPRIEDIRGFVLLRYFGYLKRDPDRKGYDFWVNVLEGKAPNESRAKLAMVCAFINSPEYQLRFGTAVTAGNSNCVP